MEERQKKRRKESRGMCEGTGQATRLRKNGKKGGHVRVLGRWATTRLWKRGKKKKRRGTCEGSGWATMLRKSGKKEESKGTYIVHVCTYRVGY